MTQRYVFWVRFDGYCFNGFAKAGGNGFGVLDLFGGLLKHVLKPRGFSGIRCAVGSRTDSGVHVLRGPISVNTESWKYFADETPAIKAEIIGEMNNTLKEIHHDSLELLDLHRVSNGFSLRKNISYRRYVYRMRVAKSDEIYENCKVRPTISCFAERNHSWTLPPGFDIHRANEACKLLEGTNNLASFYKLPRRMQPFVRDKETLTERTVDLIRVTRGSEISEIPDPLFDYYNFEVVSRSFLREQIRRMVRVVLMCAREQATPYTIKKLLLNAHPDTFANMKLTTAPAHGLYLVDCVYDPNMFTDPVPYCMHGWDNMYQGEEWTEETKSKDRMKHFWA